MTVLCVNLVGHRQDCIVKCTGPVCQGERDVAKKFQQPRSAPQLFLVACPESHFMVCADGWSWGNQDLACMCWQIMPEQALYTDFLLGVPVQ